MRIRRPAVVVALGLVTFAAMTVLVWTGVVDGLDEAVARFTARQQTSAGLMAARVITDVFSPGVDALALLVGSGVLAHRQRRFQPVIVAVGVIVVVSAVVLGFKNAVDRPLPHSHGHPAQGFPSGHTAATACFLGALAILLSARRPPLRRRLLTAVGALTGLVALALVSAGFHWLTDTIASLGLGIAVVATLALDRLGRAFVDP